MKKSVSTFCFFVSIISISLVSCKQEHTHEHHDNGYEMHKNLWNQEDRKAVTAAIEDYVEGLYLVDSTRIERSVDTTLRKLGYWYNKKEKQYRDNLPMSYDQLVRLSARWNSDGDQVKKNSPKKIEIYDINTKTASAKLNAVWGIDYFHLGKVNGQWKIFNVMWQSMPEADQ